MHRTIAKTSRISPCLKEVLSTNKSIASHLPQRFVASQAAKPQQADSSATRTHDVSPSNNNKPTPTRGDNDSQTNEAPHGMPQRKKTISELDEELIQKMSGIAGDGGEAGIEYEDGKPVAMKRSVKNNMFRYI